MRIECGLVLLFLVTNASGWFNQYRLRSLEPLPQALLYKVATLHHDCNYASDIDQSARALLSGRNQGKKEEFFHSANPYSDLMSLSCKGMLSACEGILNFGNHYPKELFGWAGSESYSICGSLYLSLARFLGNDGLASSFFPAIIKKRRQLLHLLDHMPTLSNTKKMDIAIIAKAIYEDSQGLLRLNAQSNTVIRHYEHAPLSKRQLILNTAIHTTESSLISPRFLQDREKTLNNLREALEDVDILPNNEATKIFVNALREWVNFGILEQLGAWEDKYYLKLIPTLGADKTFFHYYFNPKTNLWRTDDLGANPAMEEGLSVQDEPEHTLPSTSDQIQSNQPVSEQVDNDIKDKTKETEVIDYLDDENDDAADENDDDADTIANDNNWISQLLRLMEG